VARDVDDIVDTSSDPVIAFVITSSTVSSELSCQPRTTIQVIWTDIVSFVHVQVCVHVTLVRAPDCASQTGPWLLERQNTFDIVAVDLLARDGIDDCGLDAKEGK
jgi:hypothetical protein